MADQLPGLIIPLTVDWSGAQKGLAQTRQAVRATESAVTSSVARLGSSLAAVVTGPAKALATVASGAASAMRGLGEVTGKMASAGAMLTAGLGGAFAAAAQQNRQAAEAMSSFQATAGALAVEISRAALPVVRAVTQHIADLTAWFRSLSPEVRASIGEWASFAVQGTAVLGVLSKLAGSLGGMAAFVAPILPLAAALGVAAIAGGALYKSLKEATGVDVGTLKDAWLDFAGTMLGFYSKLGAGWLGLVNTMRESLVGMKEDLKDLFRPDISYADLAAAGPTGDAARSELERRISARRLGPDDALVRLEARLREGISGNDVRSAMKTGAEQAGAALKYSFDGLKDLFKDIGAELGLDKLLGGIPGVGKGQVIGPQITPIGASTPIVNALAPPNTFNIGDAEVLATQRREAEAAAEMAFHGAVELEQAKLAYYAAEKAKLPGLLQAFDVFAEGWHDSFMKLDVQVRGIIGVAMGHLQGMLGKAGGLFDAVTQGMTAGGPIGAVVGGLGSLLAGSQQAEGLKNILDNLVQQASDSIGTILEPVMTILGGVALALAPLFQMVADVLTALFQPLEGLSAAFVALGAIFGAFGAMVSVFSNLLGGLVGGVLNIAFRALFDVLKFIGQIILGVAAGLEAAWNSIAGAVRSFLDFVRQVFPVEQLPGLNDIISSFESMMQPSTQFGDALTELHRDAEACPAFATGKPQYSKLRKGCFLSQSLLNLKQQFLAGERLLQVGAVVFLARGPHVAARADDARRGRELADLLDQLTAAHRRHHQVGDEQLEALAGEAPQRLRPGTGHLHHVAAPLQHLPVEVPEEGLVVDDEDPPGLHLRAPSRPRRPAPPVPA